MGSTFKKNVETAISEWQKQSLGDDQMRVFQRAAKSLAKGKVDSNVYDAVNIALVDHGKNGQAVSDKFYEALKKAGYDAIKDMNDSKYSGYNTKDPLIVFNGTAKTAIDSVHKMDTTEIDRRYAEELHKGIAEAVVKEGAKKGAALLGGSLAVTAATNTIKEQSDLAYVQKYRREHPESKLSDKEIIRNR